MFIIAWYIHIFYAFKTEMDKILILQKKAMRLMTFMDSYPSIPGPLQPSGPIFSQLKTLSHGYISLTSSQIICF